MQEIKWDDNKLKNNNKIPSCLGGIGLLPPVLPIHSLGDGPIPI